MYDMKGGKSQPGVYWVLGTRPSVTVVCYLLIYDMRNLFGVAPPREAVNNIGKIQLSCTSATTNTSSIHLFLDLT